MHGKLPTTKVFCKNGCNLKPAPDGGEWGWKDITDLDLLKKHIPSE